MCLVSYSPTENGFLICSNRDESPLRSHSPIDSFNTSSGTILCPVDTKGGSWLICADNGSAICILNGAFENHLRRNDYRMSRGLMMKAFFEYKSKKEFLHQFNFDKIEPFTMVIKDRLGLYEFRWDGACKHIKHLKSDQLHVWSSSTLYTPEVQEQREAAFRKQYKLNVPTVESLIKIHRDTTLGDKAIDFVMQRSDRVATISISIIEKKDASFFLEHHNLRSETSEKHELTLSMN